MRFEHFLEPGEGEPPNAADFKRIATLHAFGDSWPREEFLDTRSRALVSVAVTAALGILEPLRGQLRIGLRSGLTRSRSSRPSSTSDWMRLVGVVAGRP